MVSLTDAEDAIRTVAAYDPEPITRTIATAATLAIEAARELLAEGDPDPVATLKKLYAERTRIDDVQADRARSLSEKFPR